MNHWRRRKIQKAQNMGRDRKARRKNEKREKSRNYKFMFEITRKRKKEKTNIHINDETNGPLICPNSNRLFKQTERIEANLPYDWSLRFDKGSNKTSRKREKRR